jgi:hypothetical protein
MKRTTETKVYTVVGVTSNLGKLVAESFNEEERWGLEQRSAQNTTPTTLQRWAQDALAAGALA